VTPKRKTWKQQRTEIRVFLSLAELPAELKHITQRCKKKVTTIAKVTASELAIFKKRKKKENLSRRPGKWKMCGSKNKKKQRIVNAVGQKAKKERKRRRREI